MLWHAKMTQGHAVGNSGQGIYLQGSDKSTNLQDSEKSELITHMVC